MSADMPRPVHNHGPEEGPGLACRESLIGDCLRVGFAEVALREYVAQRALSADAAAIASGAQTTESTLREQDAKLDELIEDVVSAAGQLGEALAAPDDTPFAKSSAAAIQRAEHKLITAKAALHEYVAWVRVALPDEQRDTQRLDWLESAAASAHCNYVGAPECWTVTIHDVFYEVDSAIHGPTLRAAIDAAMASGDVTDTSPAGGLLPDGAQPTWKMEPDALRQLVAYHVYGAYRSGLLGTEAPHKAPSWDYMEEREQQYALQTADRIIKAVRSADGAQPQQNEILNALHDLYETSLTLSNHDEDSLSMIRFAESVLRKNGRKVGSLPEQPQQESQP